jgi:glycosyltransferase involved in cell wall biosynthesis
MNVFFIPSWYPSRQHHVTGVFFKEQALGICRNFPDVNIGISLWGQNDEEYLLHLRQPLKSLKKFLENKDDERTYVTHLPNCMEYCNPRFTWSKMFVKGNISSIIEANLENLDFFADEYGKPDVIHAHVCYPAGFIAMKISEKTGIPFVITEQMSPFPAPYYRFRKGALTRHVITPLKKSSRNIAISPFLAGKVTELGVMSPDFIPNMVNEDFFKPAEKPVKLYSDFTFFTLGRMVPQKGIPDLLKAIAILKEKPYKFRIGGAGDDLLSYKNQSRSLGIYDKIDWRGELSRDQVLREFQNSDAFVLPSIHETMGVVFAEALACGRPIIATRCGGPEYIVNQENGLLTDVANPEMLASVMNTMVEKYQQYSSDAIRKDFMNRFSSKVVARQLYELYKEVAAG